MGLQEEWAHQVTLVVPAEAGDETWAPSSVGSIPGEGNATHSSIFPQRIPRDRGG